MGADDGGIVADTGGRKSSPCLLAAVLTLIIFCLLGIGLLAYRTVILETRIETLENKMHQLTRTTIAAETIHGVPLYQRIKRDSYPNETPECVCPPGRKVIN